MSGSNQFDDVIDECHIIYLYHTAILSDIPLHMQNPQQFTNAEYKSSNKIQITFFEGRNAHFQ